MAGLIYFVAIVLWFVSLVECITKGAWIAAIFLQVLIAPLGSIHGLFILFDNSWV